MRTKAIGTLVAVLVLLTLVALPVWAGDSKGLDADAARYEAMSAYYLARSGAAQSARWAALGETYGQGDAALGAADRSEDLAGYWAAVADGSDSSAALDESEGSASLGGYWASVAAGSEGLGAAEAYGLAQTGIGSEGAASSAPSGASMIALAEAYTRSLAQSGAGAVTSGRDADAARYTAMGAYYQAAAERGIEASAARYQAMGTAYLAMAGDDALAANPELRVARAWSAQSAQSIGACVRVDEDRLAANPELALVNRFASC